MRQEFVLWVRLRRRFSRLVGSIVEICSVARLAGSPASINLNHISISVTLKETQYKIMSIRETIFGLIFTIAGISIAIGMVRDNFDAISSVNWVRVDGEIITANLIRGSRGGYRADFFYVYSVNQKKIVNSRITFSRSVSATKMIEKYPLFSVINVYYDPDNPEKSVVEPGFDGSWFDCLIPLIMALLGGYVIFKNYKKCRHVGRGEAAL